MKRYCQITVAASLLMSGFGGLADPAAAAEAPLPTLKEILPRLMERTGRESENDRLFASQFVFVRSRVTEIRNLNGEIKKHEAKTSTNNPALKPRIFRPAPAPACAPEKAQPVSDRHSNDRGKAFEKDEFLVNDDLIKRFEFMLIGRERLNGRPALVVDFVPAKGRLPERSLKDKFINKAAGRIWLDEEDYALAKIALRLTERVNVVGGLVGSVWKCTYGFERRRTENGLWFAREANWHLEGREVFLGRIMDYHEERIDVRKAD